MNHLLKARLVFISPGPLLHTLVTAGSLCLDRHLCLTAFLALHGCAGNLTVGEAHTVLADVQVLPHVSFLQILVGF